MKYEHIPKFIRNKIAKTWIRGKLLKLYLKSPKRVQYVLAKFGVRVFVHKKRLEIQEFMRH